MEISELSRKEKHSRNDYFFAIGVIFLLCLLFTMFMSKAGWDDLSFLDRLNSLGYIKASLEYYNIWSSRVVIEVFLMFFAKYFTLWKLLNAVIMTGTIVLLNKYTAPTLNTKNLFLAFGLYSLIPLGLMRETGWVATTLNYHWAIFFALLAFYPYLQKQKNEQVSMVSYGISIVSIIYCSSQEQINLCFLVFTLLLTFYLIKVKRYEWKLSVLTLISIIGLVIFIFSPGNDVRVASETAHWFPEYSDFSLINKIDLGISSFGKPFFIDSNFLFFNLFALVAFLGFKKETNYFIKIVCALPAAFNFIVYLGGTMELGFTYYGSNVPTAIFSTDKLNSWFLNTGTGLSLSQPATWLPTLLILALLFCLGIGLFLIFESYKKGIIASLLLMMAFCSRVMMGFSPTVWASGIRTYFVTYIIVVILIMLLLTEMRKTSKAKADGWTFILSVVGTCAFFLAFFSK